MTFCIDGVDFDHLRPIYESIEDLVPFQGAQKVTTGLSPVNGIGLFTTQPIAVGETIAVARQGSCRTPAGRYTNHSDQPNACVVATEDEFHLVAERNLSAGEEVFIDYRAAYLLNKTRTIAP